MQHKIFLVDKFHLLVLRFFLIDAFLVLHFANLITEVVEVIKYFWTEKCYYNIENVERSAVFQYGFI